MSELHGPARPMQDDPAVDDMETSTPDVAIVGLAARFPGAADAARFWENLRDGVEGIASLTEDELLAAGVDPAHLADPRYVRAKGVLAGADRFDAGFFGFTPREAEVMDPQHRVFLECAWEALEDAGCDPARFAGRIGVWAGAGASSYLIANLLPASDRLEGLGGLQVLVLNDRDFLATRASFALDLKGPSAVVQTACSTSLYAAHLACQSLLAGECDLALAGGVAVSVPLAAGYLHEPGSVLSPDGRCRAFDARAAGSVEGNGCGIVVLRRLGDAQAAGDRIYAVIRGTAVNNDGAAKVGFTAPSVAGQAEVISESLMMADVPAETIGYVEAHGSGTPLGDPIEIAALTQAFRAAGAEGTGFCAVGSAKTAIGHCNTAAGAAGLIKAALALQNRTIPPSLHFETPNPEIDFESSPFYVPTAARPWQADGAPRRAGVSSFGLGGTNVHMVLEEAPEPPLSTPPARPAELLVLSARTDAALDAATERLADRLEEHPELDARGLADVAWTLQSGRRAFEHRRALVARDRASAVASLRAGGAISGRAERGKARPVAFLFPGLGDQHVGMARELYDAEPVFRAEVDRAAEKLLPLLGADLRELMFAAGERVAAAGGGPDLRALLRRAAADIAPESFAEARLRRTLFAQPACFVVEHALGRLLMSWGIVPQALLGYSVGEYVAAVLSGSLGLDDALSLVALRARLVDALPGGAMLAVPLPGDELAALLAGGLSLAATNGPHFSVAAGTDEAVDELARRLGARGVATVRLRTTHAFHSAAMEPAAAALARAARGVAMRPPRTPWISNVTGTWIAADDLGDPAYWARHMRGTVRFAEGLAELLSEPDLAFVEVGPGATLGTLVQQHPAASGPLTVATLGRPEEGGSDLDVLLAAVGRLWAAGVEVDWARFQGIDAGHRRRKVTLPTYPFERQRYWIEPSPAERRAKPAAVAAGDLADWFWVPSWTSLPLAGPTAEEGRAERWLVVLDPAGVGERLAALLRARGQAVATAALGAGFADLGGGAFAVGPRREDYEALFRHLEKDAGVPQRIVHLGALTAGEPAFEEAHASGLASLLLLAQAISSTSGTEPIRLALLASGLAPVLDGDPVHPAKAALLGAIKVVHQELPRLSIAAVDALLPGDGPMLDRLAEQIAAEARAIGDGTAVVALRGRRRFARGFAPLRLAENKTGAPRLRADGVYLVAGAAHGPGMAIAGHLLRHGAHVGLLLPGDFPSREAWQSWTAPVTPAGIPPEQDAVGAAIRQLVDLEREVGLDRVLLVRADDPAAAGRAVAETTARFGPLAGAFWTGGAFAGGLLQLKTPESLASALEPAARGAEALLAALDASAAAGAPRPFAVLCSTTTALSGGVGQLELAAAGAHLEALAARRANADAAAPTVAVHWDPYQWGSWLAAGVAGGMSNLTAEELQAGLRAHGVPPARSAAALERLLANLSASPAVAVSARDLPSLLAEVDAVTADTLLAQMAAGHAEKAPRPPLPTPFAPLRDELEERIARIWQDLFGIEPIGRDDSFLELGGHSLLAIQIVTQIRQALDADLPVTALFESPTVGALAKAVREARGESDPDELDALLAMVEGLSPEEAAERLAEI